ncbi:MAG: CDP-alcohol phosphatidyltransferase family protein [Acidobacteriota bacterium]|nr:MAG: CDP-alcohol phosphatidyltransferase family protein [Acidobacteriota bacterium]
MRGLEIFLKQLTVANQLTLLRLAAVPALALALLTGERLLALGLFVAAAITDRLDGIAARRWGQQTALGRFLDPAADKLMMLVTYVIMAMPDSPRPFPDFELTWHVPAWLALLVVARDVIIVVVAAGIYLTYHVTDYPPSRLGKWTTGFEMGTGGAFLLGNVWVGLPGELLKVGALSTGALVISSGVQYLLIARRRLAELDREERQPLRRPQGKDRSDDRR